MNVGSKMGFSVALTIVGLFFLGFGTFWHMMTRPYPDGITIDGIVVDVAIDWDSEDIMYSPVVEFDTRTGEAITFKSNISSSSEPTVGDIGTVSYQESDPTGARWITNTNKWIGYGTGSFGLALAVAGVFGSIFALWKSPSRKSKEGPFSQMTPPPTNGSSTQLNQEPPNSIIR